MKPQSQPQGFTLLELLLATTITALIVAFLMHAFSATASTWSSAEQRTDTFREARAALESMERDFRNAAPAARPATGLPDPAPPMLVLDFDPNTLPEDQCNEEAYAISSLPNSGKSDLCATGYHCVWDAVSRCYVLRRMFKDSDATFASFKAAAGNVSLTFNDLFSHTTADEDDVASFVWDLSFRPCENNALAAAYPRKAYPDSFPLWIEIRFKAVGASAVEKLKSLPITRATWKDPADPLFKNTIAPFAQQMVLRVKLATANAGASTSPGP